MPKLFLSFATEDLDFVTRLFSRLKKLGLDIWDYSNRDEEIAWSDKIPGALANRIIESDYFIPIVSSHSVAAEKKCIHFEVRFAIENHKKCFPVIIANRRPGGWTGAFELINDRKYLEIDHEDDVDFEEKICGLCESLKVVYQPDTADHDRLPLYRSLQKEVLMQFTEMGGFIKPFMHERLMTRISQFNLSYSLGQWEKSLDIIKYFLAITDHEIKTMTFYYPVIVKGICELQLGLTEEAEKTFRGVINHPSADESAYGGLAQVYFKQNRFKEALIQYKIALSRCPKGMETEILYNILLTAVEILSSDENATDSELFHEAVRIINNSDYILKLNAGVYSNNKERLRVKFLIGLALFRCGDYKKAYSFFSDIYEKETFRLPGNSFLSDINSGLVSRNLHIEFKNNGFFIPVGLSIKKYSPANDSQSGEKNWIISEETSIYTIRPDSDSLIVHYKELSLIIYFSQLLEASGLQKRALEILKTESFLLNNRMLFHHYANCMARQGCIGQAKEVFKKYLCQEPYDKQLLVEYALILKYFSEFPEMKSKCEMAIAQGIPKDRKECYYHGFAYFLTGRIEPARAYYEDSMAYAAYYAEIV